MKSYKKLCPTTYYRRKKEFFNRWHRNGHENANNLVGIRYGNVNTNLYSSSENEEWNVNDETNLSQLNSNENSEAYSCLLNLITAEFVNSEPNSISYDIHQWALRNKVNHNAVSELLKILCDKLKQDVPRDARTLLKTPKSISFEEITGGTLWYNGIRSCLRHSIFANSTKNITIDVNFNMDGFPLHESSKMEFWPILMNIARIPEIKPMVVAIYLGTCKPGSVEQFLRKFVDEFNDVCVNGMSVLNGGILRVKINAFICDKPARALIKCRLT